MTQLEYSIFYRQHGVRRLDQLTRPPLTRIGLFDFPKLSLMHYLGSQDGTIVGPANDEYLFRRITRPMVIENITELQSMKGPVVKRTVQVMSAIRHYLQTHRRYRVANDLTPFENNPTTTAVVNYGFIPLSYKYRPMLLAHYYQWYNFAFTVFNTVGGVAKTSRRNQFIQIKLPQVLPSVQDLRQAEKGINQTTLRKLHEPENYLILELWKWLGEDRGESMLDNIPSQNYDRVNFIFEESGRYTVLNLGVLNQLRRKVKGDETEPPNGYLKGALPSQMIQRRFLQFLALVHQQRSVDNKVTAIVPDDAKKAEEDPAPVDQDPRRIVQTTDTGKDQSLIVNTSDQSNDVINQDHHDDIVDHFALSAEMDQLVQKNLEALEEISERVYLMRRQQAANIETEDTLDEPEHGTDDKTIHTLGLTPSGLKRPLKETETAAVVHVEPHAIHHNYREGILTHVNRLSEHGLISPNEVKRYEKMASTYASIPAPSDGTVNNTTLDKFVVIDPATIKIAAAPKIPDRHTVFDKSMLDNSLEVFDSQYLKHTLQKDIAAMVLNLQHAGIVVSEYESNLEESNMGDRYRYRVRLTPIQGAASTIHFDIPAVDETGVYVVNGTQYRLRKQRSDLPIRKVGTNEVILSSYYGKLFIRRDEKRVNDYGAWLTRAIMDKGFDQSNQVVTAFHPNNVFDPDYPAPRLFTTLAQNFSSFDVVPVHQPQGLEGRIYHFVLDHRKFPEMMKENKTWQVRDKDVTPIGVTNKGELITVDLENRLRVNSKTPNDGFGDVIDLPSLEVMIGLDSLQAPVDIAVAKIRTKNIPVGLMLAYYSGFQKLIDSLGVTPRRVPARGRLNLEPHEYTIAFADETLIFSRKDTFAALLLAGMSEYHKALKSYSVHEFDHPAVYLNVLASSGLSSHHLREIDLLRDLFLDPITREKLIEMKEPHEFIPLVLKAVQLLTTDNHPRVTDGSYRHIKGYERLAGILYGELVASVRTHRGKVGQSKQPIDLHPYAVWQAISEDTSKSLVKDINPIENLKQMEAVTATGAGGVAGRMMAKVNRIYDKNDMGVISEATVDSADTAVNTFLSASPLFDSVRGTATRYESGKTGATSLFSTSGMVSPAADRDDGKRLNYLSIQMGHGVPSKAYHASALRTGYEQIIPYRTSDLFAYTAKQDGKVVSVTEHGVVVQYEDGTTKSIETGRRYGLAEGAVIPHRVVANVREGQKLKRGDLVSYHPDFFEQDPMNPGHVVWKTSMTVTVALMENMVTHEDASAISREVADQLTTETTYVKSVVVRFDQAISRMVKLGQDVDVEDVLCVVEDPASQSGKYFDEASIDTLRVLQSHVPTAKTRGKIERIDIHYRGDKSDMSESLRQLANQQDRFLGNKARALKRTQHTAEVDTDFRLDGEALMPDTAVIQFYITAELPSRVGDKGVFGNQMKTIFSEVMEHPVTTESGKTVDVIFGYKSIADRIVSNVDVIGTTTVLLEAAQARFLKAYRGK